MTEITKAEEQVHYAPLGAVPWWRQRLFVAKGWTYHVTDTLPAGDDISDEVGR